MRKTGSATGYVQAFRKVAFRIPDLTPQESYNAFTQGLKPELRRYVLALVDKDTQLAMDAAERFDAATVLSGGGGGRGNSQWRGRRGKSKSRTNVVQHQKEASSQVNAMNHRGRGRGGFRGRGRGNGRGGGTGRGSGATDHGIVCNHCKRKGHRAVNCPHLGKTPPPLN